MSVEPGEDNGELDYQDGRLNAAYGELRRMLDATQMSVLRGEQRRWIADRDSACAAPDGSGAAAMPDANSCKLDRTAKRADELQRLIRNRSAGQ